MKTKFIVCFIAMISSVAIAGSNSIDVLKVSEFNDISLMTSIRIEIKCESAFSGQTFVEIQYPGSIATRRLSNGKTQADKFENKSHSMVGFNFRGGDQINEIYVIVLTKNGIVCLDNTCADLAKQLNDSGRSVVPTDLYLDEIENDVLTISHHNQGSTRGWFSFKAQVLNGQIQVVKGTIEDV